MESVNLNIKIGDRSYPVTVPAADEPRVRAAERMINEKLSTYKIQYAGADKTDHIAMTAFSLANALIAAEGHVENDYSAIQQEINQLEQLLQQEAG